MRILFEFVRWLLIFGFLGVGGWFGLRAFIVSGWDNDRDAKLRLLGAAIIAILCPLLAVFTAMVKP